MGEMKNRWVDLLSRINRVLASIGAVLIVIIMLAISYSVLVRFLWGQPVPWIIEISSYLLLYITFLGTAWLLEQDGHVEVDLLTGNLSPRLRALMKAATSLGGAAVSFILAWKGAAVTADYFQRDVTVIGILNTPQCLLLGIIPVGGALLFLQFFLRIVRFGRIALTSDPEQASD
jgi:TRAP-type C4-dicarboxylate transport system permease small subunit